MIISNDILLQKWSPSASGKEFEKLYLSIREKENRIYTDEQLRKLPAIEPSHIHYREWLVRKRSAMRLIKYLEQRNKALSILEIGCGNGWLTGNLSTIRNSTITGTDINKTELNQAKRVFGKKYNINFREGEIEEINFNERWDVIVFAASLQYFPSLDKIIEKSLSLLNAKGEIHILDTNFYKSFEIEAAKQRSIEYFRSMGFEDMAAFYFHHTTSSLSNYNYKMLFDPNSLQNKIFGNKDPFPWIRITAK